MKTVLPLTLILLFLFGVCFLTEGYIGQVCNDLLARCDALTQTLNVEAADTFSARWDDVSKKLMMIIPHVELTELTVAVEDLCHHARTENNEEYYFALTRIRNRLKALPSRTGLAWETLF